MLEGSDLMRFKKTDPEREKTRFSCLLSVYEAFQQICWLPGTDYLSLREKKHCPRAVGEDCWHI